MAKHEAEEMMKRCECKSKAQREERRLQATAGGGAENEE
jgi:hypothetical protein